jgi:hypothetical protein
MSNPVHYVDNPVSFQQDDNYLKHALWSATTIGADSLGGYNRLFSKQNVRMISETVTDLLEGVDPQGRPIIFPDDKIVHVLNQLYEAHKTSNIGDIYSRFHINGLEDKRDDVAEINQQAINLIYNEIKNITEIEECNNKLDIFDATILGDMNPLGLRQTPKIYTRNRRPNPMEFHMRY